MEKGDVLARFQPIAATGDLGQLLAHSVSLEIRTKQLNAYLNDREISPSLKKKSLLLFQTEVSSLTVQRQQFERKRQGVIFQLEQNFVKARLMKRGLVSRVTYLKTQRTLGKTHGQLISIADNLTGAREPR